jgi:hypothetical protein
MALFVSIGVDERKISVACRYRNCFQLKHTTAALGPAHDLFNCRVLLKNGHNRRAPNISAANSRRSKSDLVSLNSNISQDDPSAY